VFLGGRARGERTGIEARIVIRDQGRNHSTTDAHHVHSAYHSMHTQWEAHRRSCSCTTHRIRILQ